MTLVKATDGARTYSISGTVLTILKSAFEHNQTIKAVRLSDELKKVDAAPFIDSNVRMVRCGAELRNAD